MLEFVLISNVFHVWYGNVWYGNVHKKLSWLLHAFEKIKQTQFDHLGYDAGSTNP